MKFRVLALVVTAGLLGACGNLLEPAAAVANGHKITTEDVSEEVDRFRATSRFAQLASQGDEGALERDVEQSYLSLLIRREVLLGEAEERGIEVTEEEVTDSVEELKETEFTSEGDFQEALKEEGLDLDQLRLRIEVDLLESELRKKVTAEVVPDEEELRTYYEDNIQDYQEVRAQHILVGQASLAARLAKQLQNAPGNKVDKLFEDLAAQYSDDPSTANAGGDLGWSTPGDYVAPFAEAITTLEVGEISDPVKTENGLHVIRVTGRRVESFEQSRAEIAELVGGEESEAVWEKWLADAYEEADVRVNSRYGELDPTTHVVSDPGAEDVPAAEVPATPDAGPSPLE
jgi:parvulin-like peptidyl-prolyl isomerase